MRAWSIVLVTIVGTGAAAAPTKAPPAKPPPASQGGAADPDPLEEVEPQKEEEDEPRSQFTIAFAGGALVPQGAMGAQVDPGLDVWGRVGWITPSGLGLVMHLEYAPLRRSAESIAPDEVVDAHLFAATAGPRFTLGRHLLRAWLAGGAGIVVERVATTTGDASSVVQVDSVLSVSGGGGVDLYFLGSGGVTVAGAYTRGLSSGAEQQYVSVNAGLVFVY